jgi:hypothetical protein
MLKMAQQLALAEADLQVLEQEDQQQQGPGASMLPQLVATADTLTPPALGLLRLLRQEGLQPGRKAPLIEDHLRGLQQEASRQLGGTWRMLSTPDGLVSAQSWKFCNMPPGDRLCCVTVLSLYPCCV